MARYKIKNVPLIAVNFETVLEQKLTCLGFLNNYDNSAIRKNNSYLYVFLNNFKLLFRIYIIY